MMCWLQHFWNFQTFHWKQQNHPKYLKFRTAMAYKAYKQQCVQLGIKPYAQSSIASKLKRLRTRMRKQNINKLTKKVNTQTKTNTIARKYRRSQKNYKIKADISGAMNAHLTTVAIYQAVALGGGSLAKLDRARKAATRTPTKNRKIIPMEGAPETKKDRRKLHRLGPISGLKTGRTTCLRGLPSWSAHRYGNSVQRLIKDRIDTKCRAEYWSELAADGIVGISTNASDGMCGCVSLWVNVTVGGSCNIKDRFES
jgi:hypothetical protein